MNTHSLTSPSGAAIQIGSPFLAKVETAPHVHVSESETYASRSVKSPRVLKHVVRTLRASAEWFAWLSQASIVRSIGPGERWQERHEFESVKVRRGGFSNGF